MFSLKVPADIFFCRLAPYVILHSIFVTGLRKMGILAFFKKSR